MWQIEWAGVSETGSQSWLLLSSVPTSVYTCRGRNATSSPILIFSEGVVRIKYERIKFHSYLKDYCLLNSLKENHSENFLHPRRAEFIENNFNTFQCDFHTWPSLLVNAHPGDLSAESHCYVKGPNTALVYWPKMSPCLLMGSHVYLMFPYLSQQARASSPKPVSAKLKLLHI